MRNDKGKAIITIPPVVRPTIVGIEPLTIIVAIRTEEVQIAVRILDRFMHDNDCSESHFLELFVCELVSDKTGNFRIQVFALLEASTVTLFSNVSVSSLSVFEECAMQYLDVVGDTSLIEHLEGQGYSRDEIFAHELLLMLPQWQRRIEKPEFKEYIQGTLKNFEKMSGWEDYDFSFEHAIKVSEEILGKVIDFEDENFCKSLVDPVPWRGKNYGLINKISASVSRFRDEYMVETLKELKKKYKKLFVVFGASHAYMQEPAVRKIFEQG